MNSLTITLLSALLVSCAVATPTNSKADVSASNSALGTCHTEDYIKCAFVIAGCTATCNNNQV